jgi:hypothetical protein
LEEEVAQAGLKLKQQKKSLREPFAMRSEQVFHLMRTNRFAWLATSERTQKAEKQKTAKFQSTYFQARFISLARSRPGRIRRLLRPEPEAPCEKYFAFRTPPMYLYVRVLLYANKAYL